MFVQQLRFIKKMLRNEKSWLKKATGRLKENVEDALYDFEGGGELDQLTTEPMMSCSEDEQILDMLFTTSNFNHQ